ncbi:MAG: hypothetical protein ACKV2V_04285 [Blastocatellia bacterium]
MTRIDRISSVALIAILAATGGWAASSLTTRTNEAPATVSPAVTVPANTFTAPASGVMVSAPVMAQPMTQPVLAQPMIVAAPAPVSATRPVLARPAPVAAAPAEARPLATRPRIVNTPDHEVARSEQARNSRTDRYESGPRKEGMSNGKKTAIMVGGGAAVGAAIGGIAKGGKGAAIGAIIGGGSGALYSIIKNKKKEPVF